MSESLFSPSWYRVAELTPRLRGHTQVYRHVYRGELWFVLQDNAKGRYYRFNPETYQFLGRMDGKRTVQELWETTSDRMGDEGLTQAEVIQLLAQLHSADILLCDVPPDPAELLRRARKIERAQWVHRLRSPMAIRIPLFDPDWILTRTVGLVRPLFSIIGALVWLAVVVAAAVLAGVHWTELTHNLVDRVLAAENVLALALVYPMVKLLHEFGHGYAVKVWGGEVHEMGIMFLVFMPVPYVDASAASEFRAKHRRIIVGAAGILVEVFLAALAVFAWVEFEPGLPRSLAYNVILIGSISTLLFNGNPLLRYDGYYVLSDQLEIPNLSKRGTGYLAYLVKRYAFRMERTPPPHAAPGERFWFVFYTIVAFFYRISIYVAIVLFLVGKFFFIGILLAIWAATNMVLVPIFKGIRFVWTHPGLEERRQRAIVLIGAALLLLFVVIFVVPLPSRTRVEGVVWPPEESLVRARTGGFVTRVVAQPDGLVAAGEVLLECRDPLLRANVEVLRARVEELESRYDAALSTDRVQAQILQKELVDVRAELSRAEERLDELTVRSPIAGRFVLADAEDLPDRYVNQGDLVAFVLDVDRPTVRVVVPQSYVDLVRHRTKRIEARPAERLDQILPAVIRREVPEAEEHLPTAILGNLGGGAIAIDPTEQSGTKTFERTFQFDIELTRPFDEVFVGGRVHVRFDHGYEPLARRWYRSLRRLFLRRFNI